MGFDYKKEKVEEIFCNLCGKDDFFVLSLVSENDLPARTCLCRNCGLIYINPRMTKDGYDTYYKSHYREERGNIKNIHNSGLEPGFESARKFGKALAKRFFKYIKPGFTIDIGSSSGGILCGISETITGLELLGIEPGLSESEFANSKGVRTINSLFENFSAQDIKPVSNIFCVQTLNHLLNPRLFFEWSFKNLKPGGHLILAVKNFRHQVYRTGTLKGAIQIDHVFMFTPENLRLFVESSGFRVVYEDVDEYKTPQELWEQKKEGMHRHHMRIVAEKPENVSAGSNQVMAPRVYRKLRLQLFRPYVKLYYFVFHSSRFGRVRKFFGI